MYITYLLRFFKSPIFTVGFVLICVVTIISLSSTLYSVWGRQGILADRLAVREAKIRENNQLKSKLSEAQSDYFVEREARDKLGYSKEGEVVIIVPPAQLSPSSSSSATSVQKREDKSNGEAGWKKWWRLFF